MDKTSLVERNIEDGRRLVQALDERQFRIEGAFWFYYADSVEWRLLLVSPIVKEVGPRRAYAQIQSVLTELHPSPEISLKNISVLSPENKLFQLLRMAISTGPGISEIRFSRSTINNIFIEDALIYRLR